MKYNKKYNVDLSDVVGDAIKWRSTGSGAYIIAEYKKNEYFIKRFTMGTRFPSKSIPEPIYSEQLEIAEWLETKQNKIHKLLAKINVDTDHIVDEDHIVIDEESFWDNDNIFVTVTRFIPNENKDFDYTTLEKDDFIKLCLDIAVLIQKTHAVGVTHAYIMLTNNNLQEKSDNVPECYFNLQILKLYVFNLKKSLKIKLDKNETEKIGKIRESVILDSTSNSNTQRFIGEYVKNNYDKVKEILDELKISLKDDGSLVSCS